MVKFLRSHGGIAAAVLMGLCLTASAAIAQEGKVSGKSEKHSAMQIQISGRVDLHYAYVDGTAVETRETLNTGTQGDEDSIDFWAGRVTIRADITLKDKVSAVVELENRDFDEGENRTFSANEEVDSVNMEQAYIEIAELVTPKLTLRIGVQDVTYRNRSNDEPFFMDLNESEGFYSGFSALSGGHVRATSERDVAEATGVRGWYKAAENVGIEAFAMVYDEGGSSTLDEDVYGVTVNGKPMDNLSGWVMACLVSGSEKNQEVWTWGLGLDWMLGENKAFELFGEVYLQNGDLLDNGAKMDKQAHAYNFGARYTGYQEAHKVWVEGAYSFRSGNDKIDDNDDESFQSYENENRFLIMQSAEFGLDIDTNIRALRAAVGYGPVDLMGRPLNLRLDVGKFKSDEVVRNAAGASLTVSDEKDWGAEGDVTATWSYSDSLAIWVKGAWLINSSVMEDLNEDDEDKAQALVFGADLRF